MTWRTRIGLFFGLIAIILIMAGVVVYIDYSHSRIVADEASIKADSYSVGIDYSGIIAKQLVQEGDTVVKGQELFDVQSNVLKQSMRELNITEKDLLYPLNDKGEIVLKASKPGVISHISYTQGSFVPANSDIANIMSTDTIFVDATFHMAERDFARVKKDTLVEVALPTGSTASGQITNITVQSQKNNEIPVVIRAKLDHIDASTFISATGTPVQARLVINPHSLYDDHIRPLIQSAQSLWPWK